MFFKRLELNGFKSFGHKTTIDFQPGFTMVVGPNGCGKSNVLDAIRWVLGETSAKSLRGGRMGDVVFRGSASTKPAGLSNVTLTLNNEQGALRIDQNEVSVTRRLYANGDSEYKINKVNCRMRDIHELFLDTGLGADGYSIIEQGQIGQMVAAKPNERRDIFEEAAGISRYKVRREETVRKLKRTQEDLDRLNDLVSEVERQCNSLRNQARKAQRHRRLTRRLHRLQQRLMVMRHEKLVHDFTEADAKRKEAAKAFEEAAAAAGRAEAELTRRQAELEEHQTLLQKLQQKRYELQSRLDAEKHRGELSRQKIAGIDERITAIQKELESRRSRQTVLQGTIEALEADFRREEEKLGSGSADLNAKVADLEETRRRNSAAQEELHRLRAELRELETRENTLKSDRAVAMQILERLTDEMGATEFQAQELSEQIEQIEKTLEEAKTRQQGLTQKLEDLRNEGKQIAEEIHASDREKKELSQRLDSLTRDMHQATSRLQALRELEDSFEGYYRGVKEVMKARERQELSGIVGVVSSLIKVPKNLEIAVEVALGSDVQDIVTETVDDAKQAIAWLKRRNMGRATFLPLNFLHSDFRTDHLQRIFGRPGILGLGRDLVEYDPKIQNAVFYLFGNTVFVEELDIAVGLEREGIRNRFVSLGGDVVNPRGVLTGGSHQTRGLLSRQREIRQLEDRVKVLESDLQRLHDTIAAKKDRLSNLYARSAEVQAEIHRLEIDEAGAHRDLQQAERDRRERRNQHASVEARLTQQRLDKVRQAEIAENSEKGLAELEGNRGERAEVLRAKEEAAGAMIEEQQQKSEAVAVARETMNNQSEVVAQLRNRLDEAKHSLTESEQDRAAREEEKTRLLSEREETLLERDEAEERLGDLARALEEATNAVNDQATANEAAQAEMRGLQGDAQRLQRDRNERDNTLREIEMRATELKAQVEYLEREAEDEFALTMDEMKQELAEAEEADRELREKLELQKEEERQRKIEERRAAREAAKQAKAAAPEGEEQAEDSDGEAEAEAEEEEPKKPESSDDEDEDSGGAIDAEEPATTPEDDAMTEPAQLRAVVTELRQKLQRMGAVNEAAIDEYKEQSERLTFITGQRDDLVDSVQQLEEAIEKIDETTTKLFNESLEAIRLNFARMFSLLFNGGKGDLILVEDEKYPEPGIDIYAAPPGKKIGGSITLMSGGEKALTAIALMFAMFQYRPSPICILDEIDAPLDDVNVKRMCDALKTFAGDTQFLIITHNKITMGLADTIYGVTMQEPGISKVVSVKFDEVEEAGLLDETAKAG